MSTASLKENLYSNILFLMHTRRNGTSRGNMSCYVGCYMGCYMVVIWLLYGCYMEKPEQEPLAIICLETSTTHSIGPQSIPIIQMIVNIIDMLLLVAHWPHVDFSDGRTTASSTTASCWSSAVCWRRSPLITGSSDVSCEDRLNPSQPYLPLNCKTHFQNRH